MADVFISYAQGDREWVKTLATALESEGFSVWWDPNLLPGTRFREIIKEQLTDAKTVIVVWSHLSVSSDWVLGEADEARTARKLLPVLREPVKPPTEFRSIHTADLSQWRGRKEHPGFRQLVAAIRGLSDISAPEIAQPYVAAPRQHIEGPRRSVPHIALIAICFAIIATSTAIWGVYRYWPVNTHTAAAAAGSCRDSDIITLKFDRNENFTPSCDASSTAGSDYKTLKQFVASHSSHSFSLYGDPDMRFEGALQAIAALRSAGIYPIDLATSDSSLNKIKVTLTGEEDCDDPSSAKATLSIDFDGSMNWNGKFVDEDALSRAAIKFSNPARLDPNRLAKFQFVVVAANLVEQKTNTSNIAICWHAADAPDFVPAPKSFVPPPETGIDANQSGRAPSNSANAATEAMTYGDRSNARVVLSIRGKTDILIQDDAGKTYFHRTLAAGDTYFVPSVSTSMLTTSDASAVEISVDGVDIGSAAADAPTGKPLSLDPQALVDRSSAAKNTQ